MGKKLEAPSPGTDLEHLANNGQGLGHVGYPRHLNSAKKRVTKFQVLGGSGTEENVTWPTTARVPRRRVIASQVKERQLGVVQRGIWPTTARARWYVLATYQNNLERKCPGRLGVVPGRHLANDGQGTVIRLSHPQKTILRELPRQSRDKEPFRPSS
jgi:hypothetical protein